MRSILMKPHDILGVKTDSSSIPSQRSPDAGIELGDPTHAGSSKDTIQSITRDLREQERKLEVLMSLRSEQAMLESLQAKENPKLPTPPGGLGPRTWNNLGICGGYCHSLLVWGAYYWS